MYARTRRPNVTTITGASLAAVGIIGLGFHLSTGSGADSVRLAASESAGVSVTCPDVAGQVGEVPAAAQAGVTQELANLERQIANVNARLAREPGQAENQLNDIAGKRSAVIDRIVLDLTRVGGTEPAGLRDLVNCSLAEVAGGGEDAAAEPPASTPVDDAGAADPGAADSGATDPGATDPGASDPGASDPGAGTAGPQTVNCPAVDGALPAIPASAADEVARNLTLLDTQIGEADARLAKIFVKPEGGPAFIQNAILGPLDDKRFAVLNRIATAIGRTADRPDDLADLASCTLNG